MNECIASYYEPRVRQYDTVDILQANLPVARIYRRGPCKDPCDPCGMGGTLNGNTAYLYAGIKMSGTTETITDEILSSKSKKTLRDKGISYPPICFKEVYHVKKDFGFSGSPSWEDMDTNPFASWGNHWCDVLQFNHYMPTLGLCRYYDPLAFAKAGIAGMIEHTVTQDELARAFRRAKPQMDSLLDSVSIPNFLLELKDIRRLGDLFSTKYKNIAQASGDKFLGINFGVLPVIGDIQTMLTLGKRIEKFVTRWNEMAEKQSTITYKATIFDYSLNHTLNEHIVTSSGEENISYDIEYTSRAILHLYVLPKKLPSDIITTAKLRLHGFDNPAAVIWEAIPFSFVVDWFSNFGDLFDAEGKDLLIYDIVDAGYSYKYKILSEASGTYSVDSADHSASAEMIPYHQSESTYTRVRLSPGVFRDQEIYNPGFVLTSKMPTLHQAALGAALTSK